MNSTTIAAALAALTAAYKGPDKETADEIASHFNALYHIATTKLGSKVVEGATRGERWNLGVQECNSAFKAHTVFEKEKSEVAYRTGCDDVIHAARKEEREYRASVCDLPPAHRARAEKSFMSQIHIPVTAFADVFPGLTSEQIVAKLAGKINQGKGPRKDKGLGYTVAKEGDSWDVVVDYETKVVTSAEKDANVGVIRRNASAA